MTLPLEPHTDAELAAMKRWAETADAEESLRERVARAVNNVAYKCECRYCVSGSLRIADAAIAAMTEPVGPEPRTSSPFKVGDPVDIFEVPGGYVVAHSGDLDQATAQTLADAARPAIDVDTTERDGER